MDLLTCSHNTIYNKYSSFDSSEIFYSLILHTITYLVFLRRWLGLPHHFTLHLVRGISPATTLTPFRAVCEAGWSTVLSRASAQPSSLNWQEFREKSFSNCVHLVSFYTHGPLPRLEFLKPIQKFVRLRILLSCTMASYTQGSKITTLEFPPRTWPLSLTLQLHPIEPAVRGSSPR